MNISELELKTKQELLELITELCNQNLEANAFIANYFAEKNYNDEELEIITKLNNKIELTQAELDYIMQRTSKRNNTSVKSLFNSKDKFIVFLVQHKIKLYFDFAWSHYPKKVGKQLSEKAFNKLLLNCKLRDLDETCKYIIKKIEEYAKKCITNNVEEQFIMHFSTFCNSKKYF